MATKGNTGKEGTQSSKQAKNDGDTKRTGNKIKGDDGIAGTRAPNAGSKKKNG